MEAYLLEKYNIKSLGAPYDANTPATPVRVSMATGDRVTFLIHLGASTAATVAFALKQHNAASGGTTKPLEVTNPVYVKAGVDTSFTKYPQIVPEDSYDFTTQFAADGGIVAIEVLAEELDVNGGFSHVSIEVADTTAAKIVSALALVGKAHHAPAYETAL